MPQEFVDDYLELGVWLGAVLIFLGLFAGWSWIWHRWWKDHDWWWRDL